MFLDIHECKSFTFMWPCIVTNFFVIKPNRCTNFTNLFCHETLRVSESSSVHQQEFIRCTFGNCLCHTDLNTAFEQDQVGIAVPPWSCSKAVYKHVWHIPLLSVQWINSCWWTDEHSETCRVSWQNKFVKLVHLVGFITKSVHLFIGYKHRGVIPFQHTACGDIIQYCAWRSAEHERTYFCIGISSESCLIFSSVDSRLWYIKFQFQY
jgi:hypothetical protein